MQSDMNAERLEGASSRFRCILPAQKSQDQDSDPLAYNGSLPTHTDGCSAECLPAGSTGRNTLQEQRQNTSQVPFNSVQNTVTEATGSVDTVQPLSGAKNGIRISVRKYQVEGRVPLVPEFVNVQLAPSKPIDGNSPSKTEPQVDPLTRSYLNKSIKSTYIPRRRKESKDNVEPQPTLKGVAVKKCTMCTESFDCVKMWSTHILKHCGVLCCSHRNCNETFTEQSNLDEHFSLKHFTEELPTSPGNDVAVGSAELALGSVRYEQNRSNFQCTVCGDIFASRNQLKAHVKAKRHFKMSFCCDACKQVFSQRNSLKYHMSNCLPDQVLHSCHLCHEIFPTLSALASHFALKHLQLRAKIYQCSLCVKSFTFNHSLEGHVNRKHKRIRPYLCEKCGASFSYPGNLKKHSANHHADSKRRLCQDCGKSFANEQALFKHGRVHSGEKKRFKCELCVGAFYTAEEAAIHRRKVHERPRLPCPSCDETFVTTWRLNQHMLKKHKLKKTVRCASCFQLFLDKSSLVNHLNAAKCKKQFLCDHCKHVFKAKCHLKVHVNTAHFGMKPFSCEKCGKTFKRHMALKTHKLLHDENMPFPCSLCEKQYAQPGNFKYHMRTAHGVHDVFKCRECSVVFSTPRRLKDHACEVALQSHS